MYHHAACTASWLLLILHVGVGHAGTHTEAELWKTARPVRLPTPIGSPIVLGVQG
jgi:hypothetical protein